MNTVNPLRAAKVFGLLFVIPFLILVVLLGFFTAAYAVLGSLGLTAWGSFPLWLTLPLLVVAPVMGFIFAGFASSPVFVLAAGLFYMGSAVLIRLKAPLFTMLVLGVVAGFVTGVAAHFVSDGNRSPWAVPLIGTFDGLLASVVLMLQPKWFSRSVASKVGVDQMALHLHITSVPAGEAPLWVREQWVGLALPLAQRRATPLVFLTSGVLSGPTGFLSCLLALLTGKLERQSGYLVESRVAVAILALKNPEAAAWWQENAPRQLKPKRLFVFQQGVGHVNAPSEET